MPNATRCRHGRKPLGNSDRERSSPRTPDVSERNASAFALLGDSAFASVSIDPRNFRLERSERIGDMARFSPHICSSTSLLKFTLPRSS
jgi:hypothetical protein